MTKGKILKQIREFCLDCMGGSSQEVLNCTTPKCSLYDFRQGKDPYPSRKRGFGSKSIVQSIEKTESERPEGIEEVKHGNNQDQRR